MDKELTSNQKISIYNLTFGSIVDEKDDMLEEEKEIAYEAGIQMCMDIDPETADKELLKEAFSIMANFLQP